MAWAATFAMRRFSSRRWRTRIARCRASGCIPTSSSPYIQRLGTPDQKARWLPGCLSGEVITCIGISEPNAGSDMRGLRTRAVRDGDDWLISGSKTFISNGWLADLALIVANTGDQSGKGAKSILLVETDRPGFRRGRLLQKVGQKAQDTAELFLDEVRVPSTALLGDEDRGMSYLMQELPSERLLIALSALANADAVYQQTVDYVRERRAFGQAIGDFQATRFALAEIRTDIEVGRAFIDDCIDRVLVGTLDTVRASMAKLWLTEMQGRCVDRCVQMFGGYGYMWEYPVARAFANARGQRIYGGTSDIMKEIIARDITATCLTALLSAPPVGPTIVRCDACHRTGKTALVTSLQSSGDHHALDVGRAFVDLANANIPIDLGETILLDIAVATKGLDGARDDCLRRLRRKQLRHRGLGQTRFSLRPSRPQRSTSFGARPQALVARSAKRNPTAWCSMIGRQKLFRSLA